MKTLRVKRNPPITQQLFRKYGGKWKHIAFHGMWVCEELDLHASYTANGGYDVNGEYTPVPKFLQCLQALTVYGLKTGSEKFNPYR
tara:strand:- start:434 stop:691 length:258 start_codon:yes stop_codon:yes gene_type:complete